MEKFKDAVVQAKRIKEIGNHSAHDMARISWGSGLYSERDVLWLLVELEFSDHDTLVAGRLVGFDLDTTMEAFKEDWDSGRLVTQLLRDKEANHDLRQIAKGVESHGYKLDPAIAAVKLERGAGPKEILEAFGPESGLGPTVKGMVLANIPEVDIASALRAQATSARDFIDAFEFAGLKPVKIGPLVALAGFESADVGAAFKGKQGALETLHAILVSGDYNLESHGKAYAEAGMLPDLPAKSQLPTPIKPPFPTKSAIG